MVYLPERLKLMRQFRLMPDADKGGTFIGPCTVKCDIARGSNKY